MRSRIVRCVPFWLLLCRCTLAPAGSFSAAEATAVKFGVHEIALVEPVATRD